MSNKIRALVFGMILLGGGVIFPSMDLPIWAVNYPVEYSGAVEDGKRQTKKLFAALAEADENDTVTITLTTQGGSILELFKILDAIELSKAQVHIVVLGYAFSAGVPFSLAGDSLSIGPNALFLVHLARTYSEDGKVNILPLDNPFQAHTIAVLDRYVSKYMTRDEKVRVLMGEDVVITGALLEMRIASGITDPITLTFLRTLLTTK